MSRTCFLQASLIAFQLWLCSPPAPPPHKCLRVEIPSKCREPIPLPVRLPEAISANGTFGQHQWAAISSAHGAISNPNGTYTAV